MTLAGMDYIAPSAACIKPTMMRTQQESSEVSHIVDRHNTHNVKDNNNDNNNFSVQLRNANSLPASP